MKKLLNQLLRPKKQRLSSMLTFVGMFLGISILLLCVDFYQDYQSTIQNKKDALATNYLILTKKVTDLHTTGMASTAFTSEELERIQEQAFVKTLHGFNKNTYEAFITSNSEDFPLNFQTLVTFESIPKAFMDTETTDWSWNENSTYVPVIIPRSYLNMYNFGMADMQGLPVISESIIRNFTIGLVVKGNGLREKYELKIAGFSDRIQSILVPNDFLIATNQRYGKPNTTIQKVIVSTTSPDDPAIASFISKNNYQTNEEGLKGSKSSFLLQLVLLGIAFFAIVVVLLSINTLIKDIHLMINKSYTDIQKLAFIGYTNKQLTQFLFRIIFIQITSVYLLSYALLLVSKQWVIQPLVHGLDKNMAYTIFHPFTLGFSLCIFVLGSILIYASIRKLVITCITLN